MLFIDREELDKAITVLEEGGVIVYPTETSYGLGCDATNDAAVARIFAMKGRPDGKGLPLIIPDLDAINEYVELSVKAKHLAATLWPGPLNIIAPVKPGSPISERCAQQGTQSLRLSSHPVAATIARRLGKPLVATSANVSGQDAIYTLKDVEKVFASQSDQPDAVVNAGTLPHTVASTTVRVDGEDVHVVRQGAIQIDL